MRKAYLTLLALPICLAVAAQAQRPGFIATEQVDYAGFQRLTGEVAPVRQERLLPFEQFKAQAAKPGVLLLDARSADAFKRGHIKGAVNLPLTDFTAESLAEVIGKNRDRPILIYCNNNFTNHVAPVALKSAPLALNIQTFINLTGYGYPNVWELADAVDFNDPKVDWVTG